MGVTSSCCSKGQTIDKPQKKMPGVKELNQLTESICNDDKVSMAQNRPSLDVKKPTPFMKNFVPRVKNSTASESEGEIVSPTIKSDKTALSTNENDQLVILNMSKNFGQAFKL